MSMHKNALALLGLVAYAGPAASAVWFDVLPSQIQQIRADGRTGLEGYYISFTQSFPGDAGCSARDFAYIRMNDHLAKDMYATALAAWAAGETITIATTGCDSVGNVIQALAIKNN
jgi:hypothetical protein